MSGNDTMRDADPNAPPSDRFELNVTLPCDGRFTDTARALAVQAARQAGCADERARAFGDDVARAVSRHCEAHERGADVPMVLRRSDGPVEVLVNGRTIAIDT